MLHEIRCDKFIDNGIIRPSVKFHDGLNVVLGDKKATNSIGKSTFLLIIDFAFGGDDYPEKATDVIRNVGEHVIQFAFLFNSELFYFSRSTRDFRIVKRCNAAYVEQEDISIEEYREWLALQYGIMQEGLSFRKAVSGYFRIYQRGNLDEKHPLQAYRNESGSEIIVNLEKLFNRYETICHAKTTLDEAQKKKTTYSEAENIKIIPFVSGAKEYNAKKDELTKLRVIQEQYTDTEQLKNKSALEIQRITELRKKLQKLRLSSTRLETKQIRIQDQINAKTPIFTNDFQALTQYFPTLNIKKIEEIEVFHQSLFTILQAELQEELLKTQNERNIVLQEIIDTEKELETFDIPNNISKKMLQEYSKRDQQIELITQQLANYDFLKQLKSDIREYKNKYDELSKSVLIELERAINDQMQQFDGIIYDGKKKPPKLQLWSSKYLFDTPDDTGTGTSYKSLIIFDLSILKLTNLPALIHDSPVLKNIGDEPLEKLIELYTQFSRKQIFIAIDKASSYNTITETRLEKATVLRLSNNASALFGRCWSKETDHAEDK